MVSRKFRIRYMKDAPRGRVTPTWSRTKLAIWVWLEAAARCKGVMPWSSIRFSFEISRSSLWSNWTISSEPCAHARWNAVLLSVSLGNNDTLQVTSYSGVTDTEPRIMLTRTSLSHIYRIFQFIIFLGKESYLLWFLFIPSVTLNLYSWTPIIRWILFAIYNAFLQTLPSLVEL